MARHILRILLTLVALSVGITTASPQPAGAPMPASPLSGLQRQSGAAQLPHPHTVRPTLVLQLGHSDRVDTVAFSPDGATVATGSFDQTARLWDAPTGRLKASLAGHTGAVTVVAFSPNGRLLATASDDGTARLWDARSGECRQVLDGHKRRLSALAFSPDGRTLATGSRDTTAQLWDVATGHRLTELAGHDAVVNALAFSPDGRTLATASRDHTARLWDIGSRHLKATLLHPAPVSDLSFSPDGQTLATGCDDGKARLWQTPSGLLKTTLVGHTAGLVGLAFSPDGASLATWSEDETARLWDVKTHGCRHILGGHGVISTLAFSPNGRLVATGTAREGAILWDAATGAEKHTLPQSLPLALAFSPDSSLLAVASRDQKARLWDTASGVMKTPLQKLHAAASAFAISPDGRTLALGSTDGAIWLWDTRETHLRVTLTEHKQYVLALAFSSDSTLLASASIDQTVRFWDPTTGRGIGVLPRFPRPVSALAFAPDRRTLALGAHDGITRVWDLTEQQWVATLPAAAGPVQALAFSADGGTIAVAATTPRGTGQVTLWAWRKRLPVAVVPNSDMAEGRRDTSRGDATLIAAGVTPARGPDGALGPPPDPQPAELTEAPHGLAFSGDGRLLATGGWRKAQLWNARTGALIATLPDPAGSVDGLAFSPDARTLATRSDQGHVCLWDVTTRLRLPSTETGPLAAFPPSICCPVSIAGAVATLHSPQDGRELAKLVPVSATDSESPTARPISLGAKNAALPAPDGWFLTTPEGYFDSSAGAERFISWNVGGDLYPGERYQRRLRRPDLVQKTIHGERIGEFALTAADIPPVARFLGVKDGAAASQAPMDITVEVRGVREIKAVELQINGRPVPPEVCHPVIATPRPIVGGAKAPDGKETPSTGFITEFTFRSVPLPAGAEEVRLRAVAYDARDLGSAPAEVVLHRAGARPIKGDLYLLTIGVSHYKNGGGISSGSGQFHDLEYPAIDAHAVGSRFQQEEGQGLYAHVWRHELLNEQATRDNIRKELAWLRASVRPGWVDTVVVFLSGHGISDEQRGYHFATYDTDLNAIANTTLSGEELAAALGGGLRAKPVFLFVDTCHAGAMNGRNDDLSYAIGNTVYIMASSSAGETSYESPEWGHGAFTLALLRSLAKRELEEDGAIPFVQLVGSVCSEVKALMRDAGRSAAEQQPCIPLDGRRPLEPVAHAAPWTGTPVAQAAH